jgi:nucleotide-binding universal stress UspA family protein
LIKRILVPLDPSPFSDSAVETACRIAGFWNAEVHGLVVLDVKGIEGEIGPVPLGGGHYARHLEKHKLEEAESRISGLLSAFRKKCEERGTTHREAELQGSPGLSIIDRAGLFDLVVIGLRTFFRFETDDKPGDELDTLLARASTPVLGVPDTASGWTHSDGKIRVLAAWDGSPAAASSLRQCFQVFPPDRLHLRLLQSGADRERSETSLRQARAYAEAYGAGAVETEWTSQGVVDAVRDRHADWAHVIAAGAHAKKGPFDFMVGSLTKSLIRDKKRTVLIGQ